MKMELKQWNSLTEMTLLDNLILQFPLDNTTISRRRRKKKKSTKKKLMNPILLPKVQGQLLLSLSRHNSRLIMIHSANKTPIVSSELGSKFRRQGLIMEAEKIQIGWVMSFHFND